MEKVIQIKNRYNDTIEFTQISENLYKIKSTDVHCKVVDYGWRCGIIDDDRDNMSFIDPPGGPFIGIGYIIPEINKKVIEISRDKNIGFILKVD